MTKLAETEKSILFMNNMAGDDLWEGGHLLLDDCPKFSPPHKLFKYKKVSRTAYNSDGIYLTYIPYRVGRNEKIDLYGFPFLPIQVDPSDIEYPTSLQGLVITQDMRMLDYLLEQDPSFHFIANRYTSRLAWAKSQNLPTVLAVHHAERYRGNIKELSRLTGMDIFCPVHWHTGEPTAGFFNKAVKAVLASS
ncbi:MAG: hypothetical protein IPP66_17795 [Anaerolineales bacterium]|nr:hypothetical protein [Anaerolineales bacterium]